jgi:hypothetical protein
VGHLPSDHAAGDPAAAGKAGDLAQHQTGDDPAMIRQRGAEVGFSFGARPRARVPLAPETFHTFLDALLDAAPEADVVIVSHAGLEGLAEVGDLVGGGLVGRTIRLRVQRFSRDEIPSNSADRLAWLDARWLEQDAWLASVEPPARSLSADAS